MGPIYFRGLFKHSKYQIQLFDKEVLLARRVGRGGWSGVKVHFCAYVYFFPYVYLNVLGYVFTTSY